MRSAPSRRVRPAARRAGAVQRAVSSARRYDLRHSFASLLLPEGCSVIYVARQLGHDARLTLTTYGHVMDELEDAPRQDAEASLYAASESCAALQLPIEGIRTAPSH